MHPFSTIRHVQALHQIALSGLDEGQRKDLGDRLLREERARDDERGLGAVGSLGKGEKVRDVPLGDGVESRHIDLQHDHVVMSSASLFFRVCLYTGPLLEHVSGGGEECSG